MKRRCIICKKVIDAQDAILQIKAPYKEEHPYCKDCADKKNIKEWF